MIGEGHMPENQDRKHLTEVAFSSLDLLPAVQEGLIRAGFTHCTPIQALMIVGMIATRARKPAPT